MIATNKYNLSLEMFRLCKCGVDVYFRLIAVGRIRLVSRYGERATL